MNPKAQQVDNLPVTLPTTMHQSGALYITDQMHEDTIHYVTVEIRLG